MLCKFHLNKKIEAKFLKSREKTRDEHDEK